MVRRTWLCGIGAWARWRWTAGVGRLVRSWKRLVTSGARTTTRSRSRCWPTTWTVRRPSWAGAGDRHSMCWRPRREARASRAAAGCGGCGGPRRRAWIWGPPIRRLGCGSGRGCGEARGACPRAYRSMWRPARLAQRPRSGSLPGGPQCCPGEGARRSVSRRRSGPGPRPTTLPKMVCWWSVSRVDQPRCCPNCPVRWARGGWTPARSVVRWARPEGSAWSSPETASRSWWRPMRGWAWSTPVRWTTPTASG